MIKWRKLLIEKKLWIKRWSDSLEKQKIVEENKKTLQCNHLFHFIGALFTYLLNTLSHLATEHNQLHIYNLLYTQHLVWRSTDHHFHKLPLNFWLLRNSWHLQWELVYHICSHTYHRYNYRMYRLLADNFRLFDKNLLVLK